MRYELLGPLRVVDEVGGTVVSERKIGTALVTLLVKEKRVVSFDEIITEIWADAPPRRAATAIYVYISLRKLLSRLNPSASKIITHTDGYVLRTGIDEFDANSFVRLMNHGREHLDRQCWPEASLCLQSALGRWKGSALSGLRGGPIIGGFVKRLLALYRCERQADALEVYQSARKVLNGQLGLDPARALRDLQQAIPSTDGYLETTAQLLQ